MKRKKRKRWNRLKKLERKRREGVLNSIESNGHVAKSTETSETSFVESHPLEELEPQSRRNGLTLQGDFLLASMIYEKLFENKEIMKSYDLRPTFVKMGFKECEAIMMCEIMNQYLISKKDREYTRDKVVPFFEFYLRKAVETESITDFGFNVLDQNSDGDLSSEEIAQFLNLFWNNKLENILKTNGGEAFLRKFMKKKASGESFEFYLRMKKVLKRPYLSLESFEELKRDFIEVGAPKELNVSADEREKILGYVERKEIAEAGLIKSIVFRECTAKVATLLQQHITGFAEDMLRSQKFATQILSKYSSNGHMQVHEFQNFLVKNLTVAEFVADTRKLFIRARAIAEEMREAERALLAV